MPHHLTNRYLIERR